MLIGSNEFYIVGPAVDPAKISEAKSAADAFQRIASAKAKVLFKGRQLGHSQERDGCMAKVRSCSFQAHGI